MDPPRDAVVDGGNTTVVGDLLSRERRSADPALYDAGSDREFSYHDLITTSYRACNVLRYLGTTGGSRVQIEPELAPKPLFTFLGAAMLGAPVSFAPQTAPKPDSAPAATVVPARREREFDLPPGSKLAVYGGSPDDPRTTHWEKEAWSENPGVPPYDVAPDDVLLEVDADVSGAGPVVTHAAALGAAAVAASGMHLSADDRVAVYGLPTDPRVLAAGVLAPITVGATVVLPDERDHGPADVTVAVVDAGATGGDVATFEVERIDLP
ncbi:acetyl-CoA synthetase [Halalkaliarchaeum sp. AArc-GB]|uniref:acetyl-CoA synthetase n=1 Tax=Halalkaliarchaeum sp. AArc-GB TaxID=3074078 RepID=UPI002854C25C|nr:acetyl-CoA synthetase [Halalkaliarchaeum sp. AArc-GB]MDR5672347.1 acetyl-CoA synthetase [Halalkaliarchaeum sp. AArc-GB]